VLGGGDECVETTFELEGPLDTSAIPEIVCVTLADVSLELDEFYSRYRHILYAFLTKAHICF
jgi:hypothetical protein